MPEEAAFCYISCEKCRLGVALSPDGTTLALSRTGEAEIRIRLLSLAGEPDHEFAVRGWPNLTGLDWSPDGKGLYCGSVSRKVARFSTWI